MIRELWSSQSPIVAQIASTAEISEKLNRWIRPSGSTSEGGILILILVAIALLWGGLYFWDRWRKSKTPGMGREDLFLQLCNLHNLSKRDRHLLRTVAKTLRVDQPAMAFVDPNLLLKFAESDPDSSLDLRHLADRLFGRGLVEEIVRQSPADGPTAL